MEELLRRGCQVDWYACGSFEDDLNERAANLGTIKLVRFDTGWRYHSWYNRHRASYFLSGLAYRARGRRKLAKLLRRTHQREPYDLIYQFSTIEIFGLRRHLRDLPPLVVHPATHAAGELRWVRAERRLAAQCEPFIRRKLVEATLVIRARRQRRDISLASRVLCISDTFARHLIGDYGIEPSITCRVQNPIDLEELQPSPLRSNRIPFRVAFIGRISTRKGVDLVVDLSHRLADLKGALVFDLIGPRTMWSDYRPLLKALNSDIATYHGPLSRDELIKFLDNVDLVIQPAKFEPFGLTVAESLAKGIPVLVTDEVGAREGVSPECCIVVPSNNVDALESELRHLHQSLSRPEGDALRELARAEAERLFSKEVVGEALIRALMDVSNGADER